MKNGGCRRNGQKDVDMDMSHVQVPPSNAGGKKKLHRSTMETYFADSHDEKI
jgi:hypothetical protein